MDIKQRMESTPREILISSAMLILLAAFRFLPTGVFESVPYSGFLNALFANTLSIVTLLTANFPFNDYVLGVFLLGIAVSPVVFREKTYSLHFLATGTLAFYGFITLALAITYPDIASDLEVLGLGTQITFLGLAATQNYKNVLEKDSFPYKPHKAGYLASGWQFVSGLGLLAGFQFLANYQSVETATLGFFAGLGFLGLAMIYSAIELTFNTPGGLWLSLIFLSVLMLVSVGTNAILGALLPFGLMVVLWMTKERYGVEDHPFDRLFEKLE